MRDLRRLAAVAMIGGLVAGCQEGPTSPQAEDGRLSLNTSSTTTTQCKVVDFDGYSHGDAIQEVSLAFDAGTFTASVDEKRYESSGVITGEDAAAYNTAFYSTATLPNDSHLDTQYDDGDLPEALCTECAPSGFDVATMAVIRDEDFTNFGDNTEGGQIIFEITEGGDLGDYEITEFLSVDDDANELGRRLFVDGTLVGAAPGDGPNGDVELVSTSSHTWNSTAIFEFGRKAGELGSTEDSNGSGGIDQIEICLTTEEDGGDEGCTPGYWKQPQHFDSWPSDWTDGDGYPSADFCSSDGSGAIFTCSSMIELANPESGYLNDISLLEALELRGGGVNALARHAAAAALNGATSVDYAYSLSMVQSLVNDALSSGEYESAKDDLAEANEEFCPLD